MAEEGQADDTVSKMLHPFFTAPKTLPKPQLENIAMPITPESSCGSASDKLSDTIEDVRHTNEGGDNPVDPDLDGRRRKRRKTSPDTDSPQPAIKSKSTRPKRARVSAGGSILNHLKPKGVTSAANFVVDGNSPDSIPITNNVEVLPSTPEQAVSVPGQTTETNEMQLDHESAEATTIPPKRLLTLNSKTGTIGSPPKPKSATVFESAPPKKRGRKPKKILVSLRYGKDKASRTQIGQKINSILVGSYRIPSTENRSKNSSGQEEPQLQTPKKATPKKTPPEKGTPRKSTPKKNTHPFFLGKNQPKTETPDTEKESDAKQAPKRQTIFTSTPCSPNRFNRPPPQKFNFPQFGSKSGGLKTPGAQHPAWPWREISHVRGDDSIPRSNGAGHFLPPISKRKAKRQEVQIGVQESVLYRVGVELNIAQLVGEMESLNANDFQPPHPLLRVPKRHFESGKRLQARVAPQLHSQIDTMSKVHPAISHAFKSIGSTLSAFDRATCENSTWAQKYTPISAIHVLQNGREAELLRAWLETLKVQAVDTGSVERSKSKSDTAPRRRGRKKQKLDGFVISSDEEEMDEISDDEDGWAPNTNQANSKKTIVKPVSKSGSRLTNAVLLSGPHGCGKTATVFAIAKELDFEVFEIGPGSRRNGKDILEKVGDMTRNHLVQHHQKEDEPVEDDIDDQVAQDLKSGKQGMMTSFFKPNSTAQAPKPKKQSKANSTQPKASSNSSILPAKTQKQKQSLILLEEVDVLYEEDKQFWATVMSMISQSKRPFIMTCNDESLVPIQSLNLHGILRFSSPPKEIAVDLLLLIAANEGHALPRQAVEALYNSRKHDLRASISELNYWCQIGVGDPRGGFDWFYPRWPKGNDVDEEGNTIRVVSEGTYQTGMGWLGRDTVTMESASQPIEEELQQQGWQHWSLDLSSSQESDDFPSWANASPSRDSSSQDQLALLKTADEYASRMSDADLCSSGSYAQLDGLAMDASLPALPNKVRDDYTIGQQLLEVSPLINYVTTSIDIAATLKLSARKQLQNSRLPTADEQTTLNPLSEPQALRAIEHSFKAKLQPDSTIKRLDYSIAFDPLAVSEKSPVGNNLDPSVFDQTMKTITLDVAPYVRSIVSYDQRLQKERLLRSNLVSEGGKPGKKRMRNTRAALSALEGGSRASTRGERYFVVDVNPHLVLRTGGEGWDALVLLAVAEQQQQQQSKPASSSSSRSASPGSSAAEGVGVDGDRDGGVDADWNELGA